jgi:hypothetical protein
MAKQNQLSLKSSKAEILEAYEEMSKKHKETEKEKTNSGREEVIKKQEEEIIKRTESYSPDSLENNISDLRKKIQNSLEETREQLVGESAKLEELRQAISVETKKLEEIYNIKLAADTLKIMIADYEIKEKEFNDRKIGGEKTLREEIENQRKEWERENEEYSYNLKLSRKKESDDYRIAKEKEKLEWQKEVSDKELDLKEREENIKKQEVDILSLRKQADDFPKKLEAEINYAKKKKEENLTRDFSYEKELMKQKWLAEKGILEVKINNLENIIKSHEEEAKSLKISLTDANKQAQALAARVVEGISSVNNLKHLKEDRDKREKEKMDAK